MSLTRELAGAVALLALLGACREDAAADAAQNAAERTPAPEDAARPASVPAKDPCRGTGLDLRALHQFSIPIEDALAGAGRPCEVEVTADERRPTELAGRFEVALRAARAAIAPSEQVAIELELRNSSARPQTLDLSPFANDAFALEVRDARGRRVDVPTSSSKKFSCAQHIRALADKRPSFAGAAREAGILSLLGSASASASAPSAVATPVEASVPVLRVVVDPGGTAIARLVWQASRSELVFKSLPGLPGVGSCQKQPTRPLAPGRYQLRLVTPLIATLHGQTANAPELVIEVDVSKPATAR